MASDVKIKLQGDQHDKMKLFVIYQFDDFESMEQNNNGLQHNQFLSPQRN